MNRLGLCLLALLLSAFAALPAASADGASPAAVPPSAAPAVLPPITGLPGLPVLPTPQTAPSSTSPHPGAVPTATTEPPVRADGEVAIPPLRARVTDLTATLSADEHSRLDARLAEFERRHGGQIVVLLLPTTQPEDIEQFGIRLAEAWKPGRQGVDDGIIVIVAKADRRMRIEVGYGYEGAVPDAVAKRIVSEQMAPHFARGDFAGGLNAAIDALMAATAGPSGAAPSPGSAAVALGSGNAEAGADDATIGSTAVDRYLIPVLVIATLGGALLRLIFGDLIGAGVTGAGTGLVGWFLSGSLQIAGLAALAGIIAALFGLQIALNTITGGRAGGGFSGGGGGFGGGGASGRW